MSKINTLQWSLLKILFYSDKDSLLMLGTSASDMDNPLVPHLLLPPWPRTAGTMPTPWQNRRIACDTLSGHSSRTLPMFFHLRKLTFTRNVHKMKESFMKCQIALDAWSLNRKRSDSNIFIMVNKSLSLALLDNNWLSLTAWFTYSEFSPTSIKISQLKYVRFQFHLDMDY